MRALVISAIVFSTFSVPAAELRVRRDVPYARPVSERQMLDVYAPADGQDHPIVVWIHGGGWRQGDKRAMHEKPQAFVDRGFVFVSINYRFVPQVTIREMTADVAKAIRWVHDHAREFGGKADTLFVMGHSAGAHLAALVCTDDRYLKAEGLPLSIVKGCVPLDPAAYDIPQRVIDTGPEKAGTGKAIFGDDTAAHRDLSPMTYVGKVKSIPPFLILHVVGRRDSTQQSKRFAEALREAGVSAAVVGAEGKTHGTINTELGLADDKPTKAVFEFVQRQLAD